MSRNKLTQDPRAIRLLTKAVDALDKYIEHVGRTTYSGTVARRQRTELLNLLREERRGWAD